MPSVSAKRIVALMFLRTFEYVCVCCCSAATAAGVGTHEIMCRGYCSALVQIQCAPVCASVRLCAFVRLCVPVCACVCLCVRRRGQQHIICHRCK